MRNKKQQIQEEVSKSLSLNSLSALAENELSGYLQNFIEETTNLSNREKMAQIGIESSVLGIPSEGPTFEKCRSLFGEEPFDYWTSMRVPTSWLEFKNIQSPTSIISKVPDLTLFFMFFSQPQDIVQLTAGQELKNRNWEYKHGKWIKDRKDSICTFDLENWLINERSKKGI